MEIIAHNREVDGKALEIYPVQIQRRLPVVRIPLRKKDDDVRLDLQAILDQAYANGAYRATLRYDHSLEPPLEGPDAKWANELLSEVGKR